MRHRVALKVKVGNIIHLKPELGGGKFTVMSIDNGPGKDPRVKYPLFHTVRGNFSYLCVRVAQNEKGEVIYA